MFFTFASSTHFNPRSREGSDVLSAPPGSDSGISIHAPAKGATQIADALKAVCAISIHAPAKGATRTAQGAGKGAEISIHAPAKGATRIRQRTGRIRAISIHAPAKGATPPRSTASRRASYFNPRSREGSDAWAAGRIYSADKFQSTLPRRERRSASALRFCSALNFNPRSREGSDGVYFAGSA